METREISIPINQEVNLKGNLNIPTDPVAFVVFSHGSGSSRLSIRNRYVAKILNEHKMATLLTDLLTEYEDLTYQNRFNINLLTDRLIAVTNYSVQLPDLKNLNVGYFGASTGAASALKAAARIPNEIKAVVSRGGRPDLAADSLERVKASTLLIVGELDENVIILNKEAYSKLRCEKDLRIVKGASHLFEEPEKLEKVAELAVGWFNKHLVLNSVIS